jgi:hypothetical protein
LGCIAPFSSGGVYLNFIMDEGQPFRSELKDHYKRLAGIKQIRSNRVNQIVPYAFNKESPLN